MNRRGFTLLETLVALTIVAIIGVAAFRGGVALIDVRREALPRLDRIRTLDRFFAMMERDFTSLSHRTWKGGDGSLRPPFFADPSEEAPGVILTLCRYASPHDVGVPGVVGVVSYRFLDGAIDYLVWPAPDRSRLSTPQSFPALDEVAGVTIRFLDDKREWRENWAELRPPRLVSLTITLSDETMVNRFFRVGS